MGRSTFVARNAPKNAAPIYTSSQVRKMLPSIKSQRPELYAKICKMQVDMIAAGGKWEAHADSFSELADWTEDLLGKVGGGSGNSKPATTPHV
jgi:prephenate dehydrogenase